MCAPRPSADDVAAGAAVYTPGLLRIYDVAVLGFSSRRIERYAPRTVQASVLEDLPLPERGYDSVACACLLHCVPGGMQRKAVALGRLGRLLVPGGTLFGATILGSPDRHTPWSRAVQALYNRRRVFANTGDDVDGLRRGLDAHFDSYELEVEGAVALFAAHP